MSPTPTTVAPTPASATNRPVCEFAQFVTDDLGVVERCRLIGTEAIWGEPGQVVGRDLLDLLRHTNPTWVELLPTAPGEGPDTVFLPVPTEQATGFGYRLHRLALAEGYVFTISPELSPAASLGREGFAGLAQRPDTFAQLFLRHCQLESRMQNYLVNFPGVVFSQRSDLSFSYLGPRAEELTGIPPALLSKDGHAFEQLIHESDREAYAKESTAHSAGRAFALTYRIQHARTGQVRHIMDVRNPVQSASGLPLGCDGMWLDITRQKVAELRLNENGWKETLAVLTSGLLHDFGNLLSGIYSLSELYHAQLTNDPSMSEGLGMIKEHARQAQVLVRKISSLNRDTIGRRNYYSLNRLTREQLELIGPILPKGIKLSTSFPPEEIPVYLDEVAFRQALVNFAINARDAMGSQGGICIQLHAPARAEDFADVTFRSPPNWRRHYTALVFGDSGCGIPTEKLSKVFDPFYTTKQTDRGTGLGLYTAQLFAENERGHIGARSRLGVGTDMVLLLPIATLNDDGSPAPSDESEEPVVETPAARRPCVLLHTPGQMPAARLEDALRARDWEVRNTLAFEEIRVFLAEKGAGLDLLFINQPETDAELPRLLELVRHEQPRLRIALEITGQNPDEIPSEIRRRVDVLLRPNRPETEIVAELARHLPPR
ncbi:MAG: PAS domain-containing protein [Opitutaceae bacterium]|nr:PAS domain-containing protein [Opitutaceae bacterium]